MTMRKAIKKEVYPSKRHMNLYYKPDHTTVPATVALYALFGLVILLGAGKLLVFDKVTELSAKQKTYQQDAQQLEQYEQQLADYDEISWQYSLYSATEEESAQVDRMEVLDLLDKTVRAEAEIESVTVEGTQVLVQFSTKDLQQTARLVQQLESSPIVAHTTVNSAFTTERGQTAVSTSILIDLQKEETP
jgi:hypothetical protein